MSDTDTKDPAAAADQSADQASAASEPVAQDNTAGETADAVDALHQRVTTAEAEASAANSQLLLMQGKLQELGLEPEGEHAIGEVAADQLAHYHSQCQRLNEELAQSNSELAKAMLQVEQAANAPKAAVAKAAKLRKISADAIKKSITPAQDGAGNPVSVEQQLLELIGAADTVEIAFSDGKNEIAGLSAMQIAGNAWRISPAGLQLTIDPLLVNGPAVSQQPFELAGYGLILNGELVHYVARGDVLEITGGATQNVGPDICFR